MSRSVLALGMLLVLAVGCVAPASDDANVARGRGLSPVTLGAGVEAAMIDAAARSAFDVEPGLALMLHPRRLPRTGGYEGGDTVPEALVRLLRTRGIVRGVCEPQRDAPRNTPRCPLPEAGYVLRATVPLRAGGDTAELYFAAERFGAATGQRPEALRMERIYQLVGSGNRWRVVREAHVKVE